MSRYIEFFGDYLPLPEPENDQFKLINSEEIERLVPGLWGVIDRGYSRVESFIDFRNTSLGVPSIVLVQSDSLQSLISESATATMHDTKVLVPASYEVRKHAIYISIEDMRNGIVNPGKYIQQAAERILVEEFIHAATSRHERSGIQCGFIRYDIDEILNKPLPLGLYYRSTDDGAQKDIQNYEDNVGAFEDKRSFAITENLTAIIRELCFDGNLQENDILVFVLGTDPLFGISKVTLERYISVFFGEQSSQKALLKALRVGSENLYKNKLKKLTQKKINELGLPFEILRELQSVFETYIFDSRLKMVSFGSEEKPFNQSLR